MAASEHSVFYSNATGEILSSSTNDTSKIASRAGETLVAEYADRETEYYLTGVKTARPAATASFDKTTVTADAATAGTPDEIVISSISTSAEITVLGSENARPTAPIEASSTTHTLQFTTPGTYRVIVRDFPKLVKEQDITAT